MNKRLAVLLITLISLNVKACKEKQDQNAKAKTKIVALDDLQLAFDLTSLEEHLQMMEKMKVSTKDVPETTNVLLITIIDKETNELLRNAVVALKIEGDNGENFFIECETIEGGSMYHYGAYLKLAKSATYKIGATVKTNGKIYTAQTKFKV